MLSPFGLLPAEPEHTADIAHGIQVDVTNGAEANQTGAVETDKPEDRSTVNSPVQPVPEADDVPALECTVVRAEAIVPAVSEADRERSYSPEDFSFAMNFDVGPHPESDLGYAADAYAEGMSSLADVETADAGASGSQPSAPVNQTPEVSLWRGIVFACLSALLAADQSTCSLADIGGPERFNRCSGFSTCSKCTAICCKSICL